ncbi:MAG TPA: TonB family protein [Candidatus Binatia bacterium]|jgi:periplasmic protein TonB|nr:TonB family protein [Candidatus Binatia bacterium]
MKDSLFSGFAISSLIHAALIPTASLLIAGTRPAVPTQRIEVSLTDISKADQAEPTPEPKPEPKKVEKITAPKLVKKTELARVEPSQPPPKLEQLPPPPELTASGPEKGSVASKAPAGEAAGGEAGVGGLFGDGDVSVAGGSGMGGGGGGTAVAGLGRGEKGDGFGGGGNGDGLAATARPLGGYQVKPRYPESARKIGAQGITLLRVRVLENGHVGEVLIEKSAGFRELDSSAAEAVKKWLFEPARRGKDPVQVWVLLPVKFELH